LLGVQAISQLGAASATMLATQTANELAGGGTEVAFADVAGVLAVRVTLTDVSKMFCGLRVASLAEIEVIGKGR
jgi:hypothetical protein